MPSGLKTCPALNRHGANHQALQYSMLPVKTTGEPGQPWRRRLCCLYRPCYQQRRRWRATLRAETKAPSRIHFNTVIPPKSQQRALKFSSTLSSYVTIPPSRREIAGPAEMSGFACAAAGLLRVPHAAYRARCCQQVIEPSARAATRYEPIGHRCSGGQRSLVTILRTNMLVHPNRGHGDRYRQRRHITWQVSS